jgi:hypothetical protein
VVTVDVIFHKCKPQGGRRLLYPHYLKALSAAAEESKMNVFELIGVLGMQIKPAKAFVAPQVGGGKGRLQVRPTARRLGCSPYRQGFQGYHLCTQPTQEAFVTRTGCGRQPAVPGMHALCAGGMSTSRVANAMPCPVPLLYCTLCSRSFSARRPAPWSRASSR